MRAHRAEALQNQRYGHVVRRMEELGVDWDHNHLAAFAPQDPNTGWYCECRQWRDNDRRRSPNDLVHGRRIECSSTQPGLRLQQKECGGKEASSKSSFYRTFVELEKLNDGYYAQTTNQASRINQKDSSEEPQGIGKIPWELNEDAPVGNFVWAGGLPENNIDLQYWPNVKKQEPPPPHYVHQQDKEHEPDSDAESRPEVLLGVAPDEVVRAIPVGEYLAPLPRGLQPEGPNRYMW